MATSLQTIKDSIDAEKAKYPELDGLTNSPSGVSKWKMFRDTIAMNIFLHELQVDILRVELERIADEAVPGTHAWYQRRMLAFQFGSVIRVSTDGQAKYDIIKPEQQDIKRCSVKDTTDGARMVIKVAGETGPLTAEQLAAAKSYLDAIKFGGVPARLVSLQPDRIQTDIEIYFDGQYVESEVKQGVIDALNNFFATLPFDGVILISKLEDALQSVPGVKDYKINYIKGRAEQVLATSPSIKKIERLYETVAGYCILEDTPGLTVEELIKMYVY